MNKRVKIAILIAFVGVIAILSLQALWLSTSYKLEQKKLIQKATPLIEQTIHETTLRDSHEWWDSIQERYGKSIRPYIGSVTYNDSLAVIKVYNPKTGLYNHFGRKCSKTDLAKYGMGPHMLYHVCGLDLGQFNLQLDSVFQVNGIYIPYH